MFCKKGVLRSFTKLIGKHLCQSLFFNKVADLRPATLLTKRPRHRCFPVNFATFLRTPSSQNTSGGCFFWLLFREPSLSKVYWVKELVFFRKKRKVSLLQFPARVFITTENTHISDLLHKYDLTALIKQPISYQSQNQNYIDQFLANRKALFKYCQFFETGISDHHKWISKIRRWRLKRFRFEPRICRT